MVLGISEIVLDRDRRGIDLVASIWKGSVIYSAASCPVNYTMIIHLTYFIEIG